MKYILLAGLILGGFLLAILIKTDDQVAAWEMRGFGGIWDRARVGPCDGPPEPCPEGKTCGCRNQTR